MRLAYDNILIAVPPASIVLRPSLRAAYRLEQKYGGFDKLTHAVFRGNLSAFSDVIKEGSGQRSALTDLFDEGLPLPLNVSIELLTDPIAQFIVCLTEIDIYDPPNDLRDVDRITYLEYHRRLYRIGTGWLGWSPEDTWNATPAEILEAYKGRREMLGAIFGGDEADQTEGIDLTKLDKEERKAALKRLAHFGDLTNVEVP